MDQSKLGNIGERHLFLSKDSSFVHRVGSNVQFTESGKVWERYFSKIDFPEGELELHTPDRKDRRLKKKVMISNCEFYDACKSQSQTCCIRVITHPKKKSFYFHAENLRTIDEFKVELEEVGGSFEGLDIPSSGGMMCCATSHSKSTLNVKKTRLETVDVTRWTKKDAGVWLKEIGLEESCEKSFRENDIDGSIIVELDRGVLRNLGVDDEDIDVLLTEVARIKKSRFFSRTRHVVKSKFSKFPGFSSAPTEYDDMIDSLCDVSQLKHKFLSLADLKSHTLLKMTKGEYDDAGENQPDSMQMYNEARIKIKIVVTEILHSSRAKNIRKMASPVISAIIPQISQDFGFFHTAIIIGPWYLEWTDSELVIPKRMVSGRAIISADVDSLSVPKEGLSEISDKIADVVVKWNTKYKYKNARFGGLKEKEGNCQDFVDDLLDTLGVKTNFQGALGNFIEGMRKDGKCVLEFSPSSKFRKEFGIREKKWQFSSHLELDNFCVNIQKKCVDVFTDYASEWSLLKSFDRAFWLRYLKTPDDPRYIPREPPKRSMDPFNTGCPFKDPRETLSYA